jgi:hypothetical protein
VWYLLGAGTVDEKVWAIIEAKRAPFRAGAEGRGETGTKKSTAVEVLDGYRHHGQARRASHVRIGNVVPLKRREGKLRMLTEAQTIYYGLQALVAYTPDKLGSDKLLSIRTACVPAARWTWPMWQEAARVVGVHRQALTGSFGDPARFDSVAAMLRKPRVQQAYLGDC